MCPIRAGADMPFLVSSLFFLSSCPLCRSGAALSDDVMISESSWLSQ
jgi:hypothetical protein